MNLSYCDYIAHLIKQELLAADNMRLIDRIIGVKYDLDENGFFLSTKKTIEVIDKNKIKYIVTVEESQNDDLIEKKNLLKNPEESPLGNNDGTD